jgi:hypothetical protein
MTLSPNIPHTEPQAHKLFMQRQIAFFLFAQPLLLSKRFRFEKFTIREIENTKRISINLRNHSEEGQKGNSKSPHRRREKKVNHRITLQLTINQFTLPRLGVILPFPRRLIRRRNVANS